MMPDNTIKRKRVLVVVKTYPNPSKSYEELVCTAGITEDGQFIRMYPIMFRDLDRYKKFQKYQWIEATFEKNEKDPRKESYKIDPDTIKVTNERINEWSERAKFVLPLLSQSIEELNLLSVSLGIIKPAEITDLIIENDKSEWNQKQLHYLTQQSIPYLLEEKNKNKTVLRKIPFKFKYKFKCSDERCKGHCIMIEDWEVGALYLNCIDRGDSPEIASKKVREKFFNQICSSKNDVYFYLGTHFRFHTWLILGVFYPKKQKPKEITIEDYL